MFDGNAHVILKPATRLRQKNVYVCYVLRRTMAINVFIPFRLAARRCFSDDNNKYTRRHVHSVFVRHANIKTRYNASEAIFIVNNIVYWSLQKKKKSLKKLKKTGHSASRGCSSVSTVDYDQRYRVRRNIEYKPITADW